MKRIKLLFAALAAMAWSGVYAQSDTEYADANAEIQANGVYKIYTQSNGSSTGSTKYYLKTDGYLTDDASAAGQFTFDFQRIFGGYKMGGYRINSFTNGGDSNNNFSGDALKKIVINGKNNRTDWEAQVFFKNSDGYAIRSTNAVSSSWGASAFWTVVEDNDADGLPNATYTVNDVPFVWQLEKITDGDYSDVTAKWIVNYEPNTAAKEEGWTVTQGTKMGDWDGHNFNNNVAEFYRRSGGGISQTVNDLPAGYYTFTAIASARANSGGTISANGNSKDIISLDINNTSSANSQFTSGNGVNTIDFALEETSNVTFALTAGTSGDAWTVYRCFYLTYSSGPVALRKALAAAKESASAALTNASYSSVTGYERTQLTASIAKTIDETGKTPSQLTAAYNELIDEINNNLSAFTSAVSWYAQLEGENTRAAMFGIAAQTTAEQSAKEACDIQTKAVYNYVTTNYNTPIDLGAWTTYNAGNMSSQHWSGNGSTTYNEQLNGWGGNTAWTTSYSQDIVLPAGDYVFKVAGRHSQNSTLELVVKMGETELGKVSDFPIGDTGRGIATNGTASFSDDANYANGGTGRGWQWRYVPFTISEESATINISVQGGGGEDGVTTYEWLSFCNYTVQAKPSVAAARIAYEQAVANANTALANSTYANVGGTDRSNLEAAVAVTPTETIEWYDEHKAIVEGYTTAFTAGVGSWNSYVAKAPVAKAEADLISTTICEGLTTPNTAAEAAAAPGHIRELTAAYVSTNYTYPLTTVIGDFTSWTRTATYIDGDGEHEDVPQTNQNQHWSGVESVYFEQGQKGWGASNGFNCTYTKTATLPAGNYVVKVAARASGDVTGTLSTTATLNTVAMPNFGAASKGIDTSGAANFGDGEFANSGVGFGWEWRFLPFTLGENGEVTITIVESTTHTQNWFSLADAVLLSDESKFIPATAEDYAALNAAIAAHTLGFEAGEYAPYNNVAAVAAVAAGQAIDQTAENAQEAVQAATAAITGATWTDNTEEVNAVYDGTFAAAENDGAPAGWTMSNNTLGGAYHARAFVLTSEMSNYDNLEAFGQGDGTRSAFYIRFDGTNSDKGSWYNYGKTDGYKMPLKASTQYYITLQAGAWGDYANKSLSVTIKDANNATIKTQKLKTTKKTSSGQGVDELTYVFETTEAGDYTLNFWNENGSNYAAIISNIELKKATPADMTITSAKYATFVAPFAVTVPEGVTAQTIDSYTGQTLNLSDPLTTIPANTPVVLQSDTEVATTVYGYATPVAEPRVGLLTGVYASQLAPAGSYVLQEQDDVVGFYQVVLDAEPTVAANRAYLTIPSVDVKAFFFDEGTATAIQSVFNGVAAGEIYDLSGRKISKLQKGVNIVNGKKVLVK